MAATWTWAGTPATRCPLEGLQGLGGIAPDTPVTYRDGETSWTIPGGRIVFAWARWCALAATPLWSCPDVLERWLQTGDPSLLASARLAATDVSSAASTAARAATLPPSIEAIQSTASAAAMALGWRSTRRQQAARLRLVLFAEHQRLTLPEGYRDLGDGSPAQRAVLRDLALAEGLSALAEVLA